jgi:hypothetical protein
MVKSFISCHYLQASMVGIGTRDRRYNSRTTTKVLWLKETIESGYNMTINLMQTLNPFSGKHNSLVLKKTTYILEQCYK